MFGNNDVQYLGVISHDVAFSDSSGSHHMTPPPPLNMDNQLQVLLTLLS